MNLPFQNAYKNCLEARGIELVWPTTEIRAKSIYKTIQIAIKQPNQKQKKQLLKKLTEITKDFHDNKNSILKSEAQFNKWFFEAVEKLRKVKFEWSQKRTQSTKQTNHKSATFGIAQKLLNLALKDWWASQVNDNKMKESNLLHGAIDGEVSKAIYRFTRDEKFKIGSVYYKLTSEKYSKFQEELKRLGSLLQKSFNLTFIPNRIQTEQLIWGWVCSETN